MIFSALIYEGILAICVLFLYFYVEPKFNVKGKGFLNTRNICAIIIGLPFMEFIIGFLLQDKACLNKTLCYGLPDIFQHSLYYDIFYLRVNDTYNGAHWIDYMFIPIIFFLTFYYTKDAFFSALNAGFMVFLHETIWFVFYWFRYYPEYQSEGWIGDIAFFILVGAIGYVAIKKYASYYKNFIMAAGIVLFVYFLATWYIFDDFHITVINNISVSTSQTYLATIWYNEPLSNEFEVFSWILIFAVFVSLVIRNAKRKN